MILYYIRHMLKINNVYLLIFITLIIKHHNVTFTFLSAYNIGQLNKYNRHTVCYWVFFILPMNDYYKAI